MPVLYFDDNNYLQLNSVTVTLPLNCEPSIRLSFDSGRQQSFVPGQECELRWGADSIPMVLLGGNAEQGFAYVEHYSDPANHLPTGAPNERLRVNQRLGGMTMDDWVNRCGLLQGVEAEAMLTDINQAESPLPIGSSLFVLPYESSAQYLRRLVAGIQQRYPRLMGFSRLCAGHRYNVAFDVGASVGGGAIDPNHFFEVPEPNSWQMHGDGCNSFARDYGCTEVQAVDFLKALLTAEPNVKVIESNNEGFLVQPRTIQFYEQYYFVHQIEYQINLVEKHCNINAKYSLSDGHAVMPSSPTVAASQTLLGVFAGWKESGGGMQRLITINPIADVGALDLPSEMEPLSQWVLAGDQAPSPLVAIPLTPGYARTQGGNASSAFYAKLQPGDLLLFSIEFGALPVVLGAPQFLPQDNGDHDVMLQGAALKMDASNGGNPASIVLNGDNSEVSVSGGSFSACEQVEVTSERVKIGVATEIANDTTIEGNIKATSGNIGSVKLS